MTWACSISGSFIPVEDDSCKSYKGSSSYFASNINGIKSPSCHHIETIQLICSANQLTAFYMMATLAFNELMDFERIN